jgi:hypothetical protein
VPEGGCSKPSLGGEILVELQPHPGDGSRGCPHGREPLRTPEPPRRRRSEVTGTGRGSGARSFPPPGSRG